jgi:hypothetical protein
MQANMTTVSQYECDTSHLLLENCMPMSYFSEYIIRKCILRLAARPALPLCFACQLHQLVHIHNTYTSHSLHAVLIHQPLIVRILPV